MDGSLLLDGDNVLALRGGRLVVANISLGDAVITAPAGQRIDLTEVRSTSGRGTLAGRVFSSNPDSLLRFPGEATLGLMSATDGVAWAGRLELLDSTVVLLDRDTAELGVMTRLQGDATLVSVHGAAIGIGEQLRTDGQANVRGDFVNHGLVAVDSGSLRFADRVSGRGSFQGDVGFDGELAPGDAAGTLAQLSFGGSDVSFAAGGQLTIDFSGDARGGGGGTGRLLHDSLRGMGALSFEGTLLLQFDSSFVAAPGTRFVMLEFGRFSGSLDDGDIVVSGYDRGALDLSRLAIDGSLGVLAVPELPSPSCCSAVC